MGDVRTPLPVDDGTVRVVVERDVVILADAPHDIISPGRLEKANVCKWDGTFNDGKRVVLINDGFLRVPLVDPLRSTHEFTSTTACTSKVTATVSVTTTAHRGLLYWFSGLKYAGNLADHWTNVTKEACYERDSKNGPSQDLLSRALVERDLTLIGSRAVDRGLFSVPCNTFSVSRFRKHPRINVLRDKDHIMKMPNLNASDLATVRVSNILISLTCKACVRLHRKGGLFIIENPVRRNDDKGAWKRFNSGKFPMHGSLWQHPEISHLAAFTQAKVAHVPLCYFCDPKCVDADGICDVPQKYITLMYSAQLEPALSFLNHARCTHRSHRKQAVGFEDGVSLGEATGVYPQRFFRVLVRALDCPSRSASEEECSHPLEDVCPVGDTPRGLPGDRAAKVSDVVAVRGHKVNPAKMTSKVAHDTRTAS